MRLFTAIDLPTPTLLRVERLLSRLRCEAHLKWSPVDNLHITTKFIGQWPEARANELADALACIPRPGPIAIELKRLGWFPNEKSPRVLYLEVASDPGLAALAEQTAACLERLGVAKEERPYAPHLTLARVREPVPLGRLHQRIMELRAAPMGSFCVSNFALYRSDPGSNASVYRKLRTYPLEAAEAAAS